jgi:flagellar biosynthesis protein FlhB
MFKNIFSKEGIWTTLTVVIQIVLVALSAFGVFTKDESENIQGAWANFVSAIGSGGFFPIAFSVITVIQQVMLALAKDPAKEPLKPLATPTAIPNPTPTPTVVKKNNK